MRLYGYVCPVCKTWAEDMTPHCFMVHEVDPIETLAIYVADAGEVKTSPTPTDDEDTCPDCLGGGDAIYGASTNASETCRTCGGSGRAPIDSAGVRSTATESNRTLWPDSGGK